MLTTLCSDKINQGEFALYDVLLMGSYTEKNILSIVLFMLGKMQRAFYHKIYKFDRKLKFLCTFVLS